jgi:hypothetical protein
MFTDLLVPRGPRAPRSAAQFRWLSLSTYQICVVLIVVGLAAGAAGRAQAASIYWTDFPIGAVARANLDGTGAQQIRGPHGWGLALDVAAGKMYTTVGNGPNALHIDRYTLNGVLEKQYSINPFGTSQYGLALDAVAGKLYWANNNGIASAKFRSDGNALIEQTQIVHDLPQVLWALQEMA